MGPTWGPPGSCQPQVGPMLAPWTLLSGNVLGIHVEGDCGMPPRSTVFSMALYVLCFSLQYLKLKHQLNTVRSQSYMVHYHLAFLLSHNEHMVIIPFHHDANGINTSSGGVCCHNAWGCMWRRKSKPNDPRLRDWTYCVSFSFHPVNVSIFLVKG